MKQLAFWASWRQPNVSTAEKFIYLLSLLALALAWGLCAYYFFLGDDNVVAWFTEGELKLYRTVLDTFTQAGFDFTIDADSYLITEKFKASNLGINPLAAYLYLGLLASGMVLLLTVATFLSRTWYLALAATTMLFFAYLGLEDLRVLGYADRTVLFGVLLAFFPLSYYFQAFDTDERFKFPVRFLVFAALAGGLAYLVATQTQVANVPLFVANYAYVIPLVITLFFVALNAHEIISGVLWLVTNSANPASGNPVLHFSVVSGVYLFNLLYAYMYAAGWADWGLYYLSPFWVLLISTALGVWGFKRKEPLFSFIPFAPFGAIFYTALGLVTLGFVGYALATVNDPLLEVLEDAVNFTHLAVGFSFFMYVLANFRTLMAQHKAVHKVMYRPKGGLEYYWVYPIAGILVMVMLFRSGFFPYRQAFAGFYNYQGDYSQATGDLKAAEQNYVVALNYDGRSHRTNYALGSLGRQANNREMAFRYFDQARQKRPTPHDYANLAELLLQEGESLQAIFKLQEGLRQFPKSGELYNNLALLFTQKVGMLDSATFYLQKSRQHLANPSVAEANFFAVAAQIETLAPDSALALLNPRPAVNTTANALVLYNKQRIPFTEPFNPDYLPDSVLQTVQLSYLYNLTLNRAATRAEGDTSLLGPLTAFANRPANADFSEFLLLAEAHQRRVQGQYDQGYKILRQLERVSAQSDSYRSNLLGTWLMEQEQYPEAARFFRASFQRGNAEGLLNQAVALSLVPGARAEALATWAQVAQLGNPGYFKTAQAMLRLIHPDSVKRLNVSTLSDGDKSRYLHFNQYQITDEQYNQVLNLLADPNAKVVAVIGRIHYYLDRGQPKVAEGIRGGLTGIALGSSPEQLQQSLTLADLRLLHALGRDQELGGLLEKLNGKGPLRGYQAYYGALLAQAKGQPAQAEAQFKTALSQMPYHAEAVVAAAQFYNQQKNPKQAYNLLVDHLQMYDDYHEFPPVVYQAYVMQCLTQGLRSFAEEGVLKLADLLPEADYQQFNTQYRQRVAALDSAGGAW
ncbi:MAG: hypothetical protein MUC97_00150 [Bernardetiaceae bacterium]|jgi:hypothetical protein|nr:hypothetical protein [Bernardetiaceae bacterium]